MALLEVERLSVSFARRNGPPIEAVQDVSFALEAGGRLGIVGESGSGKSQTAMAIMGLLPSNSQVAGTARYDGRDLLKLDRRALNTLRGERIAIVFQDPMTSLNPFLTIERQLTEPLQVHRGLSRRAAYRRAIEALEKDLGVSPPAAMAVRSPIIRLLLRYGSARDSRRSRCRGWCRAGWRCIAGCSWLR